jgi:hypothetical protein
MTHDSAKILLVGTLLAGIGFSSKLADAEDLCDGLRIALQNAGDRFVGLRGSFDFNRARYNAMISLGNADRCTIYAGHAVSTLWCAERFEDIEVARSAFVRYQAGIEACFGSEIWLLFGGPEGKTFRHGQTGDSIRVGISALDEESASSIHYVSVQVTHADPRMR